MEYKRKRMPHSPDVSWESFMKVHPQSCIGRREAASLLGQQKVLPAAWLGKTWGMPGCYCSSFCTETRAVTAAISVSSVQQTTCPMCGNPGCSCNSVCQVSSFFKVKRRLLSWLFPYFKVPLVSVRFIVNKFLNNYQNNNVLTSDSWHDFADSSHFSNFPYHCFVMIHQVLP
jgi:hypothetical protein